LSDTAELSEIARRLYGELVEKLGAEQDKQEQRTSLK
jgi:hypothetical protein